MKTHLKDPACGGMVCGAYGENQQWAIGPEAVDCKVCRRSLKFRWFSIGWNTRDKQKDLSA